MNDNILCVDDDPNILAAHRRTLRKRFRLDTATSGHEGLELLESNGPYAVVVADMRMPGMNGIEFLTAVKQRFPDTVRMMLTGHADLQTAVDAVNTGSIFRFLTKPCPPETFADALAGGIEQYRLITAERDLLQKTLTGSVKVLTEILTMVNPNAFSRASRIQRHVSRIAEYLDLPNLWQYELAAMLSQIGCVTLPPELLDKIYRRKPLTDEEQQLLDTHPVVGGKLLEKIPRLEAIARMIQDQLRPYSDYGRPKALTQQDPVATGSQLLKVALDYDQLIVRGLPKRTAFRRLCRQRQRYNPQILAALGRLILRENEDPGRKRVLALSVGQLEVGMVVREPIRARNGLMLVPRDQEITYPVLVRLRAFQSGVGVTEPIRVLVPADQPSPQPVA